MKGIEKLRYNTGRRDEVIAFFSSAGGQAFTAEEVCHSLLTDGGGRSSIYRIISALVDEGLLKKLSDEKTRRVRYQYLGEKKCAEHLHLKCKKCGMLFHLDRSVSEKIFESLKSFDGFLLDPGEVLSGCCRSCSDTDN